MNTVSCRSVDDARLKPADLSPSLATQLFPTYEPGFSGMIANKSSMPCPLLMQTELTGLLSLCRLEVSSSAPRSAPKPS